MRNRFAQAVMAAVVVVALTACGHGATTQTEPSSSPSASASPSRHSSGGVQIPTNWIHFRWPEANLTARLPSQPAKKKHVTKSRYASLTLYLAAISASPGPLEVGVYTRVGPPLSPARISLELRDTIEKLANLGNSDISSQHATTFRGMEAYTATLDRGTQHFKLLVFQKDPNREVFVFALKGAVFEAVSGSLRVR